MTVPLVAIGKDKDLNDLADLADKMFEASDATEVNAMSRPFPSFSRPLNSSESAYIELKEQIAQIESMI